MKVGMMSFAHMHAVSYANCLLQHPAAELIGIYDDNLQRGTEAAEKLGTRYFEEMDGFLRQECDAVIICSENSKHYEMVIKAARAKKHILCEKPIATKIEDAREMIKVCDENGVILQIAFPVRYSQAIRQLKRMIDAGDLGKILAIRSTNRGQSPGGWFTDRGLAGGGAVLDHTVHMIDIMRWFLGKEVTEVYAMVGNYFLDIDIDDAGLLTLEFEDGTIASHDTSWSRFARYPAWGDALIEVIGTKKTVRADAFGDQISYFKNERERSLEYIFAGNDIDEGLINDFIKTVQKGSSPSITGYDGLKAIEVAFSAYDSAKTGARVKL
ncbi:Gfo/Idh/MocA family oxidoreductase [Mesobacillus foraminis]|uniref:Gfo/Idh/MocA family protein n=1 Tax=Mesobacillus foraminis TaxID=279826 RepID=UPI001BE84AE6|nr:Gfo/Idh/MocA family oxidoreductase [Mesobacillus foraminis]MBT2758047.1 Gfo/Idh/MocA family oxidoreductase [Mesobacillus foraminis]